MREFNFTYKDSLKRQTTHRVQIFAGDSWTTVIATDRSTAHQCRSVTNSIDYLVTALVAVEELNSDRLIVIEHYDDLSHETWDLVGFERRRDGSFCHPNWKPITREDVEGWCNIAVSR